MCIIKIMKTNIVLYQTDQPQNVGSILRTATTFGVKVHLVEPLGFMWDDKRMKRAGMDYIERADMVRHKSFQHFLDAEKEHMKRMVLITTKGATKLQKFAPKTGDYYIFGQESCGLPDNIHEMGDERVVIPMVKGERSINLAQSCAIVMFDVLTKLETLPE